MSQMALRGQFSQFSGLGSGGGEAFPNPFNDVASLAMPTNMRSALYWCEYIFSMFGTYRMAMERVISYFLTDFEILKASDQETEKWTSFLGDVIDAKSVVQNSLRNRECYGNNFASVVVPFKRFLVCPKCGYMAPLSTIAEHKVFEYEFQIPEFHAKCPTCKVGSGYKGKWIVKNENDDEEKKLKVKLWNPHEIEMLHDPYSEDIAYLWRIPEDYKRLIRQGKLYHLERAPMEVIRAVHNNQMYRFNPDSIFHMKEPTLGGIYNRGWGIPRIISNFRQIWYVQVLRRFNEAIALDYVIPFRVITPAPATGKTGSSGGGGGGMPIDPMSMFSGSDFSSGVKRMIRQRRKDPASMQVLPFPVNFQMFGADANQLAPRDLLDQGMETLLNDAGTPVELYNGSLQLQTAPVALRLFESTWHHLVHDANSFLMWLVRQVSQIMSWEAVECKLKRVTIADNLEKQMMAAQLYMSQALSGTTVLGDLGYNWKKEQKQVAEEAQYQSELQTRAQEEMQQAGYAQQIAKGQGGQAQGGDPSQGGQAQAQGQPGAMGGGQPPVTAYLASTGPNVPQTPQDMMQVADSLAQELTSGAWPESVKDSELRKLKTYNEGMHAMVKARMQAIRDNVKKMTQQAGQQVMQQGGQPPSQ